MNLKNLSDQALLHQTESLVLKERQLLTDILWHLHEIERRRLFSDLGYSSLYDYATGQLKYSSDQAFRRISAMRLLKEIPEIGKKLDTGVLTLSHMNMAQTLFRQEERQDKEVSKEAKIAVLEKLESKSNREAQKVILSISSNPTPIREKQRQVSQELCELNFFADEDLLEKIQQLKGLLAHSKSSMTLSELIHYLCDLGLNQLQKNKADSKKSPAPTKVTAQKNSLALSDRNYSQPQSQKLRPHIPVKIQRLVWQKADHQCENCQSTFALQVDHRRPISLGGDSNIENLRLLCRNCNQRAAISSLGVARMESHLSG